MEESIQGTPFNDGTGFYTNKNVIHQKVYQNILAPTLDILDQVIFPGGVFVICDYGAADGGVSMELFRQCIGSLKEKYGNNQAIQVVYEDQPTNDFTVLFKRVHGMLESVTSYIEQYPDVFVSAVGTSFYKQCLPDNSVHFGFSSTAFSWLSAKPCNLKRGLLYIEGDFDDEETKCWSSQAAKDWSTILLHRAKELAPGGHVLMNCLGQDPHGHKNGGRITKRTMNAIWREMREDGFITQNEFLFTNIITYDWTTEEEFLAPFQNKKSVVYQSGLRLVSLDWTLTEDPGKVPRESSYKKDECASRNEHAEAFVSGVKAWSYNSILDGVRSAQGESDPQGIVNEFYKRFEDLVTNASKRFEMDLVHARMHIRKINE